LKIFIAWISRAKPSASSKKEESTKLTADWERETLLKINSGAQQLTIRYQAFFLARPHRQYLYFLNFFLGPIRPIRPDPLRLLGVYLFRGMKHKKAPKRELKPPGGFIKAPFGIFSP